MKPNEIYELEAWEYNAFINAFENKQKQEISNAILTGYYVAYYANAGKKAKNPNELIKELYSKKPIKQSFEEGLRDIERIKKIDRENQKEID